MSELHSRVKHLCDLCRAHILCVYDRRIVLQLFVFIVADFSGEQVVQRHMSRLGREALCDRIETATGSGSRSDLELILQDYGGLDASCMHPELACLA